MAKQICVLTAPPPERLSGETDADYKQRRHKIGVELMGTLNPRIVNDCHVQFFWGQTKTGAPEMRLVVPPAKPILVATVTQPTRHVGETDRDYFGRCQIEADRNERELRQSTGDQYHVVTVFSHEHITPKLQILHPAPVADEYVFAGNVETAPNK